MTGEYLNEGVSESFVVFVIIESHFNEGVLLKVFYIELDWKVLYMDNFLV